MVKIPAPLHLKAVFICFRIVIVLPYILERQGEHLDLGLASTRRHFSTKIIPKMQLHETCEEIALHFVSNFRKCLAFGRIKIEKAKHHHIMTLVNRDTRTDDIIVELFALSLL